MGSTDTIFALATPPGRSGVAIMRVSGPHVQKSYQTLTGRTDLPEPRQTYLYKLWTAQGSVLDEAVIIYFRAPNSYTGEDVVEYHLHGSKAVITELTEALSDMAHHRMAEPGEFTRHAYENGRMDLTEAEAVIDLIDAETSLQRDQALAQMGGALRDLYEGWAERLTRSLAHLEADLDFPDEDLPEGVAAEITPQLIELKEEFSSHLNDNRRGERLRDGLKIAVIGAPNVGKSSLINTLAQREVAITSDLAGTTRDVLEVHLNLGGYPVILYDTAGLKPELLNESVSRETLSAHDKIESEGIRRALNVAQTSDLKLLMFDATAPADNATLALADATSLLLYNKTDQLDAETPGSKTQHTFYMSVTDQSGLNTFLQGLQDKVADLIGTQTGPTLTRERHRAAVREALDALTRAETAILPELMAEDVRLAVRALGRITGRVDVEDLLDIIFSEFCIGK